MGESQRLIITVRVNCINSSGLSRRGSAHSRDGMGGVEDDRGVDRG